MAAQSDFAKLACFYNGSYLAYTTSVSLGGESGQQRVELLNEGLGGFTPGSGAVTISIGFAIPIGGTEQPFWDHMQSGAYVDLQVPIGGVDYIGTGKITTVNFEQSVGSPTSGTLEWTGELLPLQ
jgi:hypothetical protein